MEKHGDGDKGGEERRNSWLVQNDIRRGGGISVSSRKMSRRMKKAMDRFMRLGVSIRWLVEWTNEKKCWTYKTRKVIKDIVRKETNKSKKEYLNMDAMRINRENGQVSN